MSLLKRGFNEKNSLYAGVNGVGKLCDLAVLYDNSDCFWKFAIYKGGELVRLSKNIPEWYKEWQEGCHELNAILSSVDNQKT